MERAPRILLIDDDELFGALAERYARGRNIRLTYLKSPRALALAGIRGGWDLMLVDYDLQNMTGFQLVRGLERLAQDVPTLIVTSHGRLPETERPAAVRGAVNKSEGLERILSLALLCLGAGPGG
jgi:DNA-binding response OmpR family regulator